MGYLQLNKNTCYKATTKKPILEMDFLWQNYQAPDDWMNQLANLIHGNLTKKTKKTVLNVSKITTYLQNHTSNEYKFHQELITLLQRIYAILSGDVTDPTINFKPTKDAMMGLAEKLCEGLTTCTPGYHNRVRSVVMSWSIAKNFTERLKNIRQDIVERVANESTEFVHSHNIVSKIAEKKYGTDIINPNDPYAINTQSDTQTIEAKLDESFRNNYTPLLIIKGIEEQIRNELDYRDIYDRPYTYGEYGKWPEVLTQIFPSKVSDNDSYQWLIRDQKNDAILDINWPLIRDFIRDKLVEEKLFIVEKKRGDFLAVGNNPEALLPLHLSNNKEFEYWASTWSDNESLANWVAKQKPKDKFNSLLRLLSALPKQHSFYNTLTQDIIGCIRINKDQLIIDELTSTNPKVLKSLLDILETLDEQERVDLFCRCNKEGWNALTMATVEQDEPSKVKYLMQSVQRLSLQNQEKIFTAWTEQVKQLHHLDWKVNRNIISIPVKAGCLSIVKHFIEADPSLANQTDSQGWTPLYWAIKKSEADIAIYLLNQGADVNYSKSEFIGFQNPPLYYAIERGDANMVKILLDQKGINTIFLNKTNQSILKAVQCGNLEIVKLLIEHNPRLLNQVDAYGQSSLLWAAKEGHTKILNYLLKQADTKINIASTRNHEDFGKTALYWAVERGDVDMVKLLCEAKASATITEGWSNNQVIHHAAKNGFLDIVKILVDYNPMLVHEVNGYYESPLLLAALSGHASIVEYLANKEANIELSTHRPGDINKHDKNPLYWAIEKGHADVVEILCQKGVNTRKELDNNTQDQAIHLAVKKGRLDVVQALIRNDSNLVDLVDASGNTPLLLAISKRDTAIVTYLISQKADIKFSIDKSKANDGKKALDLAIEHGSADIVEQLCQAGAAILEPTATLVPPIHVAIKAGRLDLVKILVKYNPAVLEQLNDNKIPLSFAASIGQKDIVEYLLLTQHRLLLPDKYQQLGSDALNYAIASEHSAIVKLIIKHSITPNPNQPPLLNLNKLDKEAQAMLKLVKYIERRGDDTAPDYYPRERFSNIYRFFSCNKQEKVAAARFLQYGYINGVITPGTKNFNDKLKDFKKALNHGELKSIYDGFKR